MDSMNIKQWRKQQREQLLAVRTHVSREQRRAWTHTMTERIVNFFPLHLWQVTGFYWPFQGEFDPRFVIKKLRALSLVVALPEVVQKNAPLQFRQWWLGAPMVKGVYDLPVPENTPIVVPTVLLIPPVGFDEEGYRLGYGGGYFDRTLATMQTQPVKIGVAFELNRIPTIYPQPHDIPMDFIVTEKGVYAVNTQGNLELLEDHDTIQKRFANVQAARQQD
jgi:5,10-methenyltetrahydrofolate synthetase